MDTAPKEKSKKKYEKSAYCCVPQCGCTTGSFHHFPKDPTLRKKWQDALKLVKKPSNYVRVCGHHFRPYDFFPGEKSRARLKKNVIPSLNIPGKHSYRADGPDEPQNRPSTLSTSVSNVTEHTEIIVPEELEQIVCKPEMIVPEESNNLACHPETIVPEQLEKIVCKPEIIMPDELEQAVQLEETVNVEPKESFDQASYITSLCNYKTRKRQKTGELYSDPLQLQEEDFRHRSTSTADNKYHPEVVGAKLGKYPFILTAPSEMGGIDGPMKPSTKEKAAGINILPIHLMVKNPEILCFYTGLRSFELLNGIIRCVSDIEIKSPTNTKLLSLKDRVLLVFITLKMNMDFGAVAPMFNISRYTCVRYFRMLVPLLATVLESAIAFPTDEDIRVNLPIAFKNYTDSKVVTDCVKTPVERSKCLKCKILTYSHNRKHHAVKFKLGISPAGLITSVTQCYQGKPSNKFITLQSHVLDKLDLQDKDLTDRGFFIESDCLERNIILHQLPFVVKTTAASSAETIRKAKNSKPKMHAERVIDRVREFAMLNSTITWHLLPYIENCLVVVCGIVNLGNPILSFSNFT